MTDELSRNRGTVWNSDSSNSEAQMSRMPKGGRESNPIVSLWPRWSGSSVARRRLTTTLRITAAQPALQTSLPRKRLSPCDGFFYSLQVRVKISEARGSSKNSSVAGRLPGRTHPSEGRPFRLKFTRESISLARWIEATVFLKLLENLPSLAVGHESGEYLAQHFFFCGRLVREEDQLLKLHPTMNGF